MNNALKVQDDTIGEQNRGMHKTYKNYFEHMWNAQGQVHKEIWLAYTWYLKNTSENLQVQLHWWYTANKHEV